MDSSVPIFPQPHSDPSGLGEEDLGLGGTALNRRPDVMTFDCYGTLIDWETGIRDSFRQALAERGSSDVENRIFELYEQEERRIEKELPYRSYRQVLSETVSRVARKTGWELAPEQSGFLARDLPSWKPFQDTNPALKRLVRKYRLGILSNVDDDLLSGTLKHLAVPFEIIVTAEQVKAYKPSTAHFEKARKIIGDGGEWLHVAGSLYHDIEPARKLGIETVWVNRKNQPPPGNYPGPRAKQVDGLEKLAIMLNA